jgi:hypothetical protein
MTVSTEEKIDILSARLIELSNTVTTLFTMLAEQGRFGELTAQAVGELAKAQQPKRKRK